MAALPAQPALAIIGRWYKDAGAGSFRRRHIRFMGQYIPDNDQYPLEDQLKTLADDELLDFWEEAQMLDRPLGENAEPVNVTPLEYERIILQELMLRSCMRGAGPR